MSRIVLRGVPDHLHREIRQAAARNRRTLSAEILFRLEESFGQGETPLRVSSCKPRPA